MVSGVRHRVLGVVGSVTISTVAVAVANHPLVQRLSMAVPVYNNLRATTLSGSAFEFALGTTLVVVVGALFPLFKPRPRRILDTIMAVERRAVLALVALAAVGYFDYTYRLPRTTLVLTGLVLLVALPPWFVAIRRRPAGVPERAILVGDDREAIERVRRDADITFRGYVAPPGLSRRAGEETRAGVADGGVAAPTADLDRLGGLSRLDEVLVDHDADAAVLAFSRPDREEFFGALDTCYEHGVTVKVHREHADYVLTSEVTEGDLVTVDLEPWDPQDYALKRAFDVAFALGGLVVLAPVIAVIAVAIKLDSPGPVLYRQVRTATFGDTFPVYKFRSMVPDSESDAGAQLSDEDAGERDPRVTRVGRVLRWTHLDEIPQLWSILVGHMSVVGPRPERPELDHDMESSTEAWRRRWFVKPGLTGLAQINDVTGFEPERKLRYDMAYIRRQSFWFDLRIVIRQLWIVGRDAVAFLRGGRS